MAEDPLSIGANELLRRYAAGERDFRGIELPEQTILQGAILDHANFAGAMLSDIDFRHASLRGANLSHTNVKCSDFREADLTNAQFTGAAVEAIRLRGARLDGTSFSGAGYYGHTLTEDEITVWVTSLSEEEERSS